VLFSRDATFDRLNKLYDAGGTIGRRDVTDDGDPVKIYDEVGDESIPLALVNEGRVRLVTAESRPKPRPGDVLLTLEPHEPDDLSPPGAEEEDEASRPEASEATEPRKP